MSISQNRFVDIKSGVAGATAVPLQSQAARVFTPSKFIGSNEVLTFYNADTVIAFFGDGREAKYAKEYFAYISPPPISGAKELQFASFSKMSSSKAVGRGKVATLESLKMQSISLSVKTGGKTEVVTGDISEAGSYSEVASSIKSDAVTVGFEAVPYPHFILTSSVGDIESIENGESLGFDDVAIHSQNIDTATKAMVNSVDKNNSFFTAYFLDTPELKDAISLAEYIASKNGRYQLYLAVDEKNEKEFSEALINTSSVGLLRANVASLPSAVIAAIDYDRTNATVNMMFRQSGVTITDVVDSDAEAGRLDKLRVNYYGQTAVSGARIAFFQRGFLCGTGAAMVDMGIHANEQWLRSYIEQQWFSLLINTRGIQINTDGKNAAYSVLEDTATKAINNGTILRGKTLNVVQRKAITDMTNDHRAYIQVEEQGYWYSVQFEEVQNLSNVTEYVMKYTFIYAKGDFVRKIEGSHNLI